jgi:hypothetical protein
MGKVLATLGSVEAPDEETAIAAEMQTLGAALRLTPPRAGKCNGQDDNGGVGLVCSKFSLWSDSAR